MAFVQLPPARRAMRAATFCSMPLRAMSSRSMSAESIGLTSMRCVRLLIVSSSWSGCSLTMMNRVCPGGSSSSLSILFAQVWFILSGSHIMHTLYPPMLGLRLSMRVSSSLSAPVIIACWFAAPMAFIHCSNVKYGPLATISRHSFAKSPLTGWCSLPMDGSLMVG